MSPKPGACAPLAVGGVALPCSASGPDLFISICAEMAVVREIPFGPITQRFVNPAFGEGGGGMLENRQVTLPAASLSMVKSRGSLLKPIEPADVPTVTRFPSHRPSAHSPPGSNCASAGPACCWANDGDAGSARITMFNAHTAEMKEKERVRPKMKGSPIYRIKYCTADSCLLARDVGHTSMK